MIVACQHCNGSFRTKASQVLLGKGKFCSVACAVSARPRTEEARSCEECGSSFVAKGHRIRAGWGRFCSARCHDEARMRRAYRTCEHCGSVWSVPLSRLTHGPARYCSKACYIAVQKSTAIPKADRHWSAESRNARRNAIERDGFQCVECGSDADLSVHHVVPFADGGTNDLANLATLCRPCHEHAHRVLRELAAA